MEGSVVMADTEVLISSNWIKGAGIILLAISCFLAPANLSAQQSKKGGDKVPAADVVATSNRQEAIGQLFGIVNELKSAPDQATVALLQSEVADLLWQFDEPAARAIFRLAFDTVRQPSPNGSSSIDATAKKEAMNQSRRRISALRTILKRYGLHDRKGAEAWLKNFEGDVKAERPTSRSSDKMSQEQAELIAEMALGVVLQNPQEALRLGLLSLSGEEIPSGFGRLLMELRGKDKRLGDLFFRQAVLKMRLNGLKYDAALLPLTNYQFFSNGQPLPDASRADVGLIIQYFVDAAAAQAARCRNGLSGDERASMGRLYNFLAGQAMPIVGLNSPDRLVLLQSNVNELARWLDPNQQQQAAMLAALKSQTSDSVNGDDSNLDSQIHRAEGEKDSSTRNLLLRNLALRLMRRDPERALSVAGKIDNVDARAQTEDDVYLALLQNAFGGSHYDEARTLALKFNDPHRRTRWLTQIAGRVSSGSKDHTDAANLLSQAYSIAEKSDNTPAKLQVLLLIANEFVRFDQDRGFEILSNAVSTANRLEKVQPKTNTSSPLSLKVIRITVVGGKEVSTDDRETVDSIDFDEISEFVKRNYIQTSLLGSNIRDDFLRAKYFIALARSILNVPRKGPGYERTLEDMISN